MIGRLMRWCVPDRALRSTYRLTPQQARASVLKGVIRWVLPNDLAEELWGPEAVSRP